MMQAWHRLVHRLTLAVGIAVLMGVAVPLAQAQSDGVADFGEDDSYEQASLDFITWCGPCHGRTGTGNGPVAPNLKAEPPDLTRLLQREGGKFPREMVRKRIDGRELPSAHGSQEMPVWGYWFNLQETAGGLLQEDRAVAEKEVKKRIGRLVDYLETLQK